MSTGQNRAVLSSRGASTQNEQGAGPRSVQADVMARQGHALAAAEERVGHFSSTSLSLCGEGAILDCAGCSRNGSEA